MKRLLFALVLSTCALGCAASGQSTPPVITQSPYILMIGISGNMSLVINTPGVPLIVNGPGHSGTDGMLVIPYMTEEGCKKAEAGARDLVGLNAVCARVAPSKK